MIRKIFVNFKFSHLKIFAVSISFAVSCAESQTEKAPIESVASNSKIADTTIKTGAYLYDNITIRTQAYLYDEATKTESSLPTTVPLFTVVARPDGSSASPAKAHKGSTAVDFTSTEGVVAASNSIGIYIPTNPSDNLGYKSEYRISETSSTCKSPMGAWIVYDEVDHDLLKNSALKVNIDSGFSTVAACIVVQWRLTKKKAIGMTSWLIGDVLSVAPDGRNNMMATHTIAYQAKNGGKGGIELALDEKFGGLAKTFKIKSKGGEYLSILRGQSAPTDDGLNYGVMMEQVSGLWGSNDARARRTGSSQFAGRIADSGFMWGLKVPLAVTNNRVNQANPERWFPMWSDYVNVDGLNIETLPFLLPRSVHPWDGQISLIGMKTNKNNTLTHLEYSMRIRANRALSIDTNGTFVPHLWTAIDRDLVESKNGRIYIVYEKPDNSLVCRAINADDAIWNPSDKTARTAIWSSFCMSSEPSSYRCKDTEGFVKTTCSCTRKGSIARVITKFKYNDVDNVAISLYQQGSPSKGFGFFSLSMDVRPSMSSLMFYPSIAYTSGEKNIAKNEQFSESYMFSVGTMSDLNTEGLGLPLDELGNPIGCVE